MSDVARAVEGLFLGQDVEVDVGRDRLARGRSQVRCSWRSPASGPTAARFVPEAFEHGAAGALVATGWMSTVRPSSVRSTGEALMMLARDERARMDATVVAVTGANGKTSTKDMAAAVLATRFRTHASRARSTTRSGCR